MFGGQDTAINERMKVDAIGLARAASLIDLSSVNGKERLNNGVAIDE